jgi:hypothetical protein
MLTHFLIRFLTPPEITRHGQTPDLLHLSIHDSLTKKKKSAPANEKQPTHAKQLNTRVFVKKRNARKNNSLIPRVYLYHGKHLIRHPTITTLFITDELPT